MAACPGVGSATGAELRPVIPQAQEITILEPASGFASSEIGHESVPYFHISMYRQVTSAFAAQDALGLRTRLEGTSLAARVSNRVASFSLLEGWLVRRGEAKFAYPGRGHSVFFAAQKNLTIGSYVRPHKSLRHRKSGSAFLLQVCSENFLRPGRPVNWVFAFFTVFS